MTDRELLELAAKAAGIEYDPSDKSKLGLWLVIDDEPSEHTRRRWNPLTDDGDALRLAVKLRLHIINDGMTCVCRTGMPRNIGVTESLSGCQFEATRRAIVRAAAEIGKAME